MKNQSRNKLRKMLFYALCCDLGLFSKRLIAPIANLLTDALRIPGGIGTAFSIMFIIVAASLTPAPGCATLMSFLQCVIALAMGMTGSMGLLAPVGYIVPGLVTDMVLNVGRLLRVDEKLLFFMTNMLAAAAAAETANLIVFHLSGMLCALYLSTALFSGAICGLVGHELCKRLKPVVNH